MESLTQAASRLLSPQCRIALSDHQDSETKYTTCKRCTGVGLVLPVVPGRVAKICQRCRGKGHTFDRKLTTTRRWAIHSTVDVRAVVYRVWGKGKLTRTAQEYMCRDTRLKGHDVTVPVAPEQLFSDHYAALKECCRRNRALEKRRD